jgi:hypothetical protein
MENEKMSMKTQLLPILPHIFIFGGIVLIWLGLDSNGLVMGLGFIGYGVIGLIESIKKNYYKDGWLKILKCLTQILLVAFAVNYIITGLSFIVLLMLMLLDTLVLTTTRIGGFVDEKS